MAQQFCVDIADSDVDRVITAMCANPETPYQFVNRMGREFLENNTVAYELNQEKANVPQPTPPDITDPQV
jgi:hypothetical protein